MKIDRTFLLIGTIGFATSTSGILFPVARKILLCVLLLGFGALLMDNSKEKRPRNHNMLLALIFVPIFIASFFFKFPGDVVFAYGAVGSLVIFLFSFFPSRKQSHIRFVTYVVFFGAIITAVFLNHETIAHSASWFLKNESSSIETTKNDILKQNLQNSPHILQAMIFIMQVNSFLIMSI